jgi:hypothetical protein
MYDLLPQLCCMRDEVLQLMTERLAALASSGLRQSKLVEGLAERLFNHRQRGTLSCHGLPHLPTSLQAEPATGSKTTCYRDRKQVGY